MHWWDINAKSFRWISAIKNTYWHALVGLYHKIFSAILSYQEYLFTFFDLLTCIGGTLTQNLFGEFQQSRMHIDKHWWDFTTKFFRQFSVIKNTYSHSLIGPKKNLFDYFQLSRILINLHWWHLNTKSFRRFSAIKNTYWHALVWWEHKIVSAIFSFQEHFLRCIGGTLTQNLFGKFNISKMHIDTNSSRRFAAIKNTYGYALVGPENQIFWAIFSFQRYLWTCIDGT